MTSLQKKDGFENEIIFIVPSDFLLKSWEHPLIKALHISDAGYFPKAEHHYRERTQGVQEAILIYCVGGEGFIELPLRKIHMKKNCVFCIPPEMGHRYYASKEHPWSILWIHFKGEQLSLYPIRALCQVTLDTPESNNRLQEYFIQLLDILGDSYTQGNFICVSNLLSVILGEIYFRGASSATDKKHQLLTKAIQYMYNHVDRPLTLAELTGYMQLSKSYLSNLFNELTNHSPIEFFTRLKIQQACKDLKLTNVQINSVAQKLGFEDQFYFSRIFKKVTGVSPRDYQNGKGVPQKSLELL